jgi:transcriptional regulator with XRE-family HTH domain
MATFQERLLEAMKKRDVSAAELARLTGLTEGAISQYKKGNYKAKQDTLEKLSNALNVSIPWLMGADVPMERFKGEALAKNKAAHLAGKILSSKDEKKIGKTLELLEIITNMNYEQLEALSVLLRTIK